MNNDAITTPKTFKSFILEEKLGGGSYGHVYRAKGPPDLTGGTGICALKVFHRLEQQTLARLENEAYALSKLSHPSIPKLYCHGMEPSPYIAMELVAGTSIRKLMLQPTSLFEPNTIMGLIKKILEVLAYIHGQDVLHRDIKDDNIIVSSTFQSIWLVDFGFCRAAGEPKDPRTWGDVGANLYSPPSKLDHPGLAIPNHDVFAVGVLAYLMLSGKYPWFADDEAADRGHLVELLKTAKPSPLIRLVPAIPRKLAKFIEDLINIDDDVRPESLEAFERFKQMESFTLEADVTRAIYQTARPLCPRVFRDPLHGDIRLTEFEWSVLNTPAMQRLGYIKQLGTTHYVYRGATHMRILHSIGTLHIIERIMTSAEEVHGDTVDEEVRLAARLYALLHDVTHISFGHTLEDELGLFPSHDKNWARADRLVGVKTEIGKLLHSASYGRSVLKYFDPAPTEARNQLAGEMLASPAGADVLDYLDRDALFCGLGERVDNAVYRRFRILHSAPGEDHFTPTLVSKHGLRVDAASAISKIFSHRYSLYEKVYCHRVKICSGAMLGKALLLACKTGGNQTKPILTEEEIEQFGDDELLLRLRNCDNPTISRLARRILSRVFYETVFVGTVLTDVGRPGDELSEKISDLTKASGIRITTPEGRSELEQKIVKRVKKGLKAENIVVYITPEPPGYARLLEYKRLIQTDQAIEADFTEIRRRHIRLWRFYAFCANPTFSLSARISEEIENILGLSNELPGVQSTLKLPLMRP